MDIKIKLGLNELGIENAEGADAATIDQMVEKFYDEARQHAEKASQQPAQPAQPSAQQPGQKIGQQPGQKPSLR